MSTALRSAAAVTAALAAAGAAIGIGSIKYASAESAVATSGVNIRSGPGTSYDIVGGLVPGQRITTTGEPENGWVPVGFNGTSAYISADYLDIGGDTVSSDPVTIYTEGTKVATAPLNVRSGPGTADEVIGYVAQGQNVTLTGKQSGGFAEVLYGGERAWVTAEYLVSSVDSLPSKTHTEYATADLLIRTSTGADFLIVTTVEEGTELEVTGTTQDGYAQVIYNDARRWVTADYLSSDAPATGSADSDQAQKPKPDPEPKPDPAPKPDPEPKPDPKPEPEPEPVPDVVDSEYATTALLIRTTPDSDYRTVETVPFGAKLRITGSEQNGRAQVIHDGEVRWVTAQYLSDSKPQPEPEPAPDDSGDSDASGSGGSSTGSSGGTSTGSSGGSSAGAGSYSGSSTSVSGSTWDRLAMCESSGDWSINTGNGFYGGLQFTLQTWHGFGGYGMPQDASREEQIQVAERVLAVQGWGAWPACSSELGLR